MDVGRDPFAPYSGDLRNLRKVRPSLFSFFFSFHCDRIHRVCLFADRDFRSLVTLRRLAKWELGPEPLNEAIAHEITVRRSKFLPDVILNT